MYLKSRDELQDFADAYSRNPALRRGIRLALNVNTADILLVIYWGHGKSKSARVIERILARNGGRTLLSAALSELLTFSHFKDWDVRIACENTAYLIATALDRVWEEA